MSGMGFNRNGLSNLFAYLFGSGVDGNVTISANTDLTSTLNGDIVYRNYMNLTINSGCTLSVSNMCRGLWIRVRGTLTLNGTISMSNKGCYIAGGGSDLYLCYSDIKVPAVGAAGAPRRTPNSTEGVYGGDGYNGSNGTDGQCGGGGGGGAAYTNSSFHSGAGAAGGVFGGGTGGSGSIGGCIGGYLYVSGEDGQAYGLRGGNGASGSISGYSVRSGGGAGGVTGGTSGGSSTAGGVGSGGILIVMANHIVGSGSLLAQGASGGHGSRVGSDVNNIYGASGGGSGGGSITLFYYTISGTPTLNAPGGAGGAGGAGNAYSAGGNGGAGSCRDYSLAELLSHTRV